MDQGQPPRPVFLKNRPVKEAISHPDHYGGDTTYETIKVLQAWMTREAFEGFCIANVIKYLSRAGKKIDDKLQDWKKARWYLDYIIAATEEDRESEAGRVSLSAALAAAARSVAEDARRRMAIRKRVGKKRKNTRAQRISKVAATRKRKRS